MVDSIAGTCIWMPSHCTRRRQTPWAWSRPRSSHLARQEQQRLATTSSVRSTETPCDFLLKRIQLRFACGTSRKFQDNKNEMPSVGCCHGKVEKEGRKEVPCVGAFRYRESDQRFDCLEAKEKNQRGATAGTLHHSSRISNARAYHRPSRGQRLLRPRREHSECSNSVGEKVGSADSAAPLSPTKPLPPPPFYLFT